MKKQTLVLLLFLTFLFANVSNTTAQQKYGYVDLGLPSGTLWATSNIGAGNPWDNGDYFAWGEIEPKDTYSWSNYKHGNGNNADVSKKYNEIDSRTTLETSDDVAYQKWGSEWCMPTQAQFQELYDNCTNEWTANYQNKNVTGRIFKSKNNGNSIFFPAAGSKGDDGMLMDIGDCGGYWASSLYTGYPDYARDFYFNWSTVYADGYGYRCYGGSVRPVRCKE